MNDIQQKSIIHLENKVKEKPVSEKLTGFFGSPSWTRTNDPAVNSRMLYQLSYRGVFASMLRF